MSASNTTPKYHQPTVLEPVYDRITYLYETADADVTGDWDPQDVLEQLEAEGHDLQAVGRFLVEQFVESVGGTRASFHAVEFPAQLWVRA